ncbi:hypothetical protein T265_07318 [Opisthorchis viverrini]|uniref:Uncharacterized protein n=1 Tax=Opisthorchis viverrini TaxID=6198 RepID=A0A074ZDB4_OPIVI|nr:hypothetical protein T265_07318 [Opisthorchis viverrini]KER25153.1 hypothetical protein T265_07318 [Opisthorchis viverrini]
MPGRCLLQSLCKGGLVWDEPLSNLRSLRNLRFPRCIKPREVDGIPHAELHVFCDVSETAYSAVAYSRFLVDAEVFACLLEGAGGPLKSVSITRLELTAMCLAVRVADLIRASTKDYLHRMVFWTDSVIVLYYIHNASSRFCTFVATRLTGIRDISSPTQWGHVSLGDNRAEIALRGTHNLGPPQLTRPHGVQLKSLVEQVNRLEGNDVMCPLMSRFSCSIKLQKGFIEQRYLFQPGRGNKLERSRYGTAGFLGPFGDPGVVDHRPDRPKRALPKFKACTNIHGREPYRYRHLLNGDTCHWGTIQLKLHLVGHITLVQCPRLTQLHGVQLKSLVEQVNRSEGNDVMCPSMSRFSCWMKLQKVAAWLRRYRQYA